MATRALIIDDHLVVRNVLHGLLERSRIEVVGEAADLAEGLRRAQQLNPDVIVLDGVLPETDGLVGLTVLADALPDARIVYLGTDGDSRYVKAALDAGAAGYVLKDEADTQLVPTLQALEEANAAASACA